MKVNINNFFLKHRKESLLLVLGQLAVSVIIIGQEKSPVDMTVEALFFIDDLSAYVKSLSGFFISAFSNSVTLIAYKMSFIMVRYVENGGVLYLSGVEDTKVIERLLGARFRGWTDTGMVYMAPTDVGAEIFCDFTKKYPFPTEMSLPLIEVEGAEVLATMTFPYTKTGERRFASIHSNPPGIPSDIPAMLTKKLGRGTVIWSACPIENDSRRSHRKLLKRLIAHCIDLNAPSVRTNAPRQVELVTFRRENDTLISAVDLLCTDELLPVPKFTAEVKCTKPAKVVRIGGKDREDAEIPFTWADGYVKFDVNSFVMFEMYRIKY